MVFAPSSTSLPTIGPQTHVSQYTSFDSVPEGELHVHDEITPVVLSLAGDLRPGMRVLDVGCGKGDLLAEFLRRDCEVTGIDISQQGITIAREKHPKGRFENLLAEGDLLHELKPPAFDLVLSTEVVEHLYSPRDWARSCYDALAPGGTLVCSTPYHGYLKNLALSIFGHWDQHANPLWDGGHIKLWSRKTLTRLLEEVGFEITGFKGVGRFPGL